MAFASLRKKLAQGLSRTRESISTGFQSMLGRKKIDEESLEDLEAAMLSADIGPLLTEQVLDEVRTRARKEAVDGEGLRSIIKDVLMNGLPDVPEPAGPPSGPRVCFVVGINGGGKTTSVGKLAARHRAAGRKVMVVAADTFRTAAIEQLETWATRADVDLVKRDHGADPSSVVFDALEAAKARGNDLVLVDTAGRLHTKSNLMNELGKLARVAARVIPDAPHDVLLVVDATTGQNGLTQAKEFSRAAALTGVVLTKLDGTAKGGVALSIHRELGVPIRYVGVGEQVDDLLEFDRPGFVDSLLG
ncbi:cell division protein FtsY [Acidobacteria bacterium Mor1]|nr:cell division protein FtsY [Acidobacteria bacterium Mor1]